MKNKPDDVDNDVIQQLVDRFLNKGTLENDKTEKLNKEIQALIGSSDYWKTDSIKVCFSKTSLEFKSITIFLGRRFH